MLSLSGRQYNSPVAPRAGAWIEKIFQEKVSGRSPNRPELLKLLEQIRPGDTLIAFSVDRLGGTKRELVILLNDFKEKGITFKSLSEGIFDTSSPKGEAIFQIIAILKAIMQFVGEHNIFKQKETDRKQLSL